MFSVRTATPTDHKGAAASGDFLIRSAVAVSEALASNDGEEDAVAHAD